MSFLNPVSLPVKRFSSTDEGAPQVDYNSRAAGDIKTLLKACLVTGYGTTESAGWSMQNEDDYIAEFVSPDIAMSDYRLCVDDTSASSTTWYYQYQDERTNPVYNKPTKNISNIDKSSDQNGWQLLVTDRGLYFIEIFYREDVDNTVARMTWMGQIKSALVEKPAINMSYMSTGYQSRFLFPSRTFSTTQYRHCVIKNYDTVEFSAANILVFQSDSKDYDVSVVDTIAQLFLTHGSTVIGQQPALLLHDVNNTNDALGVKDVVVNDRPCLSLSLTYSGNPSQMTQYAKRIMLYTDTWDF